MDLWKSGSAEGLVPPPVSHHHWELPPAINHTHITVVGGWWWGLGEEAAEVSGEPGCPEFCVWTWFLVLQGWGLLDSTTESDLIYKDRASLMVQKWLRLRTLKAGDTGSIPGQGRSTHYRGRAKKISDLYKADFPTWKMCLFLIVAQMEVLFPIAHL